MTRYRMFTLIGAVVFFLLAALNLWRIMVGFPIAIGGVMIGNTVSFFAFAAFVALGVMMLREARTHD
jgi:putative Ca2+/H+ antiporter (TMEM165/GDT1 family)